ncbi:hypothetical protein KTD14_09780 [Burkholderia multivorans]|uniref:hypothetical protein n=1 Tax=Burkholderia multivorans TaxID=87883 RepID=UPI001C214ADD|nr:hypothetical protein [Burkholderia multivorans]MBU9249737.1 hypothetical protein [Burkholderia multivorans]MBU9256709.1 hypothetical protein [Burkholderia multivorans]
MLSRKRFVWLALFVVLFCLGLSIRGIRPNISGDGLEYTLMAQALLERGRPNITEEDYRALRVYRGDAETNVPEVAARSSLSASPPFFRDAKGQYYSYHFWLYSLFVVPFFFAVKLFGLATPWAFVMANVAFALAASCTICAWRGVNREQRLLLLTLYWSCGTIPYISWTHPEVFSASLLVIAMIAALSRQYVVAAVAAAMVAQQNPPALFLVAIFLVVDFYVNIRETKSFVPPLKKIAGWCACVALSGLSVLFYYFHFGVGNLITNSGFTKIDLISVERLWSFYFDLNQGLVVLLWPLLVVVPMAMLYGTARRRFSGAHIALVVALVFASILLAVPSISATNFNSGASFVIRYAYWAGIPLLFAVTILFLGQRLSRVLVCVAVVALLVVNFVYYKGEWWSYLYYTPVAKKIMAKFPWLYNPVPEIFIERGLHIDGSMNDNVIYYYAADGEVRKVLLNQRVADVVDFRCANGDNGRRYVDSVSSVEQGWTYFNLKPGCKAFEERSGTYEVALAVGAGDTLSFRRVGSGRLYLGQGWSEPEAWGTWSDQSEASIVLPVKKNDIHELSFTANALVSAQRPKQVIDIFINDVNAGSVSLSSAQNNEFNISVPRDVFSDVKKSGVMKVNFRFRDLTSPKNLGINGDDRTLGVGLISLMMR